MAGRVFYADGTVLSQFCWPVWTTGAGEGLLLDAKFIDSRLPRASVGDLRARPIARCGICQPSSLVRPDGADRRAG
jgi:hypothetical protein